MTLVLIIEGNLVTANYMAKTLSAAGFETRAADSQTEGLAIYQERKADLVLTNYYLGQGNGLGLIRAMAKMDPGFLAVMTTGVGNERIAREAIVSGAFDYIVKNGNFYRDLPGLVMDCLERHKKETLQRQEESQRVRLEAQVELASWLDHNFKNILAATAGSLALIDFQSETQTQAKREEYLADGMEGVKSAIRLLDRLSVMSLGGSAEDARHILIAQVVDAAYLSVREEAQKAAPEDRPALERVLAKVTFLNNARALPPQRAVYDDLLTILESLIKNSLEALAQSKGDPMISVSAQKNGAYLDFEVRDNGRGMDEKAQRYAFEPLFSTKGKVGVGVSLAIVRSLVFKHFGEIGCESTLGEGAVFKFSYYVGEDADESPRA
ncbi:MAG: response regulator [Deltaproteobacteria bacterium]|nr:response regulator [Deltaproteobacteria bacterium]